MSNLGTSDESYLANQLTYNPAAANWDTMTVSGSSVAIGGTASAALSGPITGFGLVVQGTGALLVG